MPILAGRQQSDIGAFHAHAHAGSPLDPDGQPGLPDRLFQPRCDLIAAAIAARMRIGCMAQLSADK